MAVGRQIALGIPILLSQILCAANAAELAMGIYGPITSVSNSFLATAVAFDIDFRKNFEPQLVQKYGPPIVKLTNIHPDLKNVTVRIGTSDSDPDIGVQTALDFFLGRDGKTPISALVGGYHSAISMPVASTSAVFKVPQVSWGSTNPSLSNKDVYPYFLRTIPPDSIQGMAIWAWVKHFKVPAATILHTNEPYGEGLQKAIVSLATQEGQPDRVASVAIKYMPANYDDSKAVEALNVVKKLGRKFIIVIMNPDQITQLLPLMESAGLLSDKWQILGSEAFTVVTGRFVLFCRKLLFCYCRNN